MATNLDQLSDELGEKITLVKVNVDENQQIAGKHGSKSSPTMMLYKGGKPVETIIGFQAKNKLMEKIQGHLN